jgi:hypothetical protein
METNAGKMPEQFSRSGFCSVQLWTELGGLRIVGFRSAQSKIPNKLQSALRALKCTNGRWQMFLRDIDCATGSDFPTYTWQNGCWEVTKEDPWLHGAKKRMIEAQRKSAIRNQIHGGREMRALFRLGAEPSALAKKPKTWKLAKRTT